MEYFNNELDINPSGFNSTGSTCYFNSTLQLLTSCTSFIESIIKWQHYVSKTELGKIMVEYAISIIQNKVDSSISIRILEQLLQELKIRKPHINFGIGQDSAGEAIIHLIDMLEVPKSDFKISPITLLFEHRINKSIYCKHCKKIVMTTFDTGVTFNDFDKEKSSLLFNNCQDTKLQDYKCDVCKNNNTCVLTETLSVVPEIIVMRFNIYDHQNRKVNTLKKSFTIPGTDELFTYKLLGYVEHSGTLNGGHYWATCVRKKEVYTLNDMSVNKTAFTPSENIYLAIYHVFKS
jgi:uncharacterized UBP type Zn finger protein